MPRYPYSVGIDPDAADEIRALPRHLQDPVIRRIAALGEDPRPSGFEKWEGDACRIFFMGCRIAYWVDDANSEVNVARVVLDEDKLADNGE